MTDIAFKTFINESDKQLKFLTIIENEKGELIGISMMPMKNTDIRGMLRGDIIWGGDTLSDTSTPQSVVNKTSDTVDPIVAQTSNKVKIPTNGLYTKDNRSLPKDSTKLSTDIQVKIQEKKIDLTG